MRCKRLGCVRCAFSGRNLHSRMPLDPTHVRLKLLHACDQWHSSRKFTSLTGLHCKFRPNTEGAPHHDPISTLLPPLQATTWTLPPCPWQPLRSRWEGAMPGSLSASNHELCHTPLNESKVRCSVSDRIPTRAKQFPTEFPPESSRVAEFPLEPIGALRG
jgi:hypothetical protein